MSDPILTASEVAEKLRCCKAHVYDLARGRVRGVQPLPSIRLGARILVFRESSIEKWLGEQESGNGVVQ